MTTKTKPGAPPAETLHARGRKLTQGEVLGSGREGTVHQVQGDTSAALKLIGPNSPDPAATARKLEIMIQNPPAVTAARGHLITWPKAKVTWEKGGATAGYLMTKVDPALYQDIGTYFNPARRRKRTNVRGTGYTYLHLLVMARNLAAAVARLHAHQTLIGDINSRNVLASDRGRIAIIDTDSFQIRDPDTDNIHRCLVGTPEYTPPRLQGMDFAERDRSPSDDLFALAVMLYQLLMQGAHPYGGTQGGPSPLEANVAARISNGRFAHDESGSDGAPATPASDVIWTDLPLKRHFRKSFRRHGLRRTSASAWVEAIEHAAKGLRQCPKNPLHRHFTRRCTWCRYLSVTGLEPFPDPQKTAPAPKRRPRKKNRTRG